MIEERPVPTVRNGEFLELTTRLNAGAVWVVRLQIRQR
jgi:hypothetical protein